MVSVITPGMVTLQISSSLNFFTSEKRFAKDIAILEFKGKLELITGASSYTMELRLFDKQDKLICALDNDGALLGSYPVEDNMRIHVVDTDPTKKAGEFEDVSQVKKFELDDEAYNKKSDSVRAFKKAHKLGRFAETTPEEEEERRQRELIEEEKANSITLGSRCEVVISGAPPRRGQVMFVGKADFKPGWWVGIKYDEPVGKNNGSVKGKQYFECPPKYGGFVRPKDVTCGDFPEEDLGLDEM